MQEVLQEGVDKGMWREAKPQEIRWISQGFLVLKLGKKGRLVVNYAPLNKFLSAPHFKMEGWREVRALATKDRYAGKINLQSAYYQIPLNQESAQYLAFKANRKTWIPCRMPFGINLAPDTFTNYLPP